MRSTAPNPEMVWPWPPAPYRWMEYRWTYSLAATGPGWSAFSGYFRPAGLCGDRRAQILWCPAVISYDESGAGKITWFDVAPGLVYSLSADSGASRDALLDMVNRLFTPAQGEVG